MLRLPFTDGMVNRVVIPRDQRFAYDQAVRMTGAHMIEVASLAELDRALAEPVAMFVMLGKLEGNSGVRLEEIVKRARPRQIPILVDAASEHLERPVPWLERGADLAVYSGGKFLRGPQTSGLLLGKKPLVEAAWRNASPHQALGRPMKVSKEDVIGVLAALEYWFGERDSAAEAKRWLDDLEVIAGRVARRPGAKGEILPPSGVDRVPRLRVEWDRARYPLDGLQLRERLLAGEPRVMLDDNSATENTIAIDPFQLQPGEAAAVGEAIAAALDAARGPQPAQPELPPAELAGEWDLLVRFLHGSRQHRLTIEQHGHRLSGRQRSPQFEGPLEGMLDGVRVRFAFRGRYEGSNISYRFEGGVADGRMQGRVALGAASDTSPGIVNRSQFGDGEWQAQRVA
jgi:hypothetical protein